MTFDTMTTILRDKILQKIHKAADSGNFEIIASLNTLGRRVDEIESILKNVRNELAQIEKAVNTDFTDDFTVNQTRPINNADTVSSRSYFPKVASHECLNPIAVEINFPRLGIDRPLVTISESKASDTLRSVIEVLVEAMGHNVIERLSQIRINRGPLISRKPDTDYVNSATGQLYANHPIGSTDYYVLTHSSTSEKIQILHHIADALNLSKIFFRIIHNKQ